MHNITTKNNSCGNNPFLLQDFICKQGMIDATEIMARNDDDFIIGPDKVGNRIGIIERHEQSACPLNNQVVFGLRFLNGFEVYRYTINSCRKVWACRSMQEVAVRE